MHGQSHTARAINEVSMLRQTYQAAKLRISIDSQVRLRELSADGILVATPAGSTAYNLSVNGPILPLNAPLLALTPISAFRPRHWRGALLPDYARIEIEVLEPRGAARQRGRGPHGVSRRVERQGGDGSQRRSACCCTIPATASTNGSCASNSATEIGRGIAMTDDAKTTSPRRIVFRGFHRRRRPSPHRLTRTVTQMDNMLFSNMTLNPQPLHIDAHFCATETEWGKPLMNSLFTLGLMIGISVNDTTVGTTIANLGMTDVTFPNPLFEGDTVNVTTEIASKREFEIAARCGHRRLHPPRLQAGRHAGGAMPAAGLHAQAPRPREESRDALAALRSRRQPAQARKGARIRRRRAAHRPRGFGRARPARQSARQVDARLSSRDDEGHADRPRLYVRVNGLTTGLIEADLDAVMPAGPDGVVLPKTVGGADVSHLGAKLAVREAEYGLPDGATRILAIATENAAGVFALGTFAGASHRLMGIAWGGEDLSADLGAEANRRDDGAYTEPYRIARAFTLLGAAAAARRRDRFRLHQFPRSRRPCAPNAAMPAATASSPRWRSTRPRSPSSTRPSRPPPMRSRARRRWWMRSTANPGAGVVGVEGEMLDRPHLLRAERLHILKIG